MERREPSQVLGRWFDALKANPSLVFRLEFALCVLLDGPRPRRGRKSVLLRDTTSVDPPLPAHMRNS